MHPRVIGLDQKTADRFWSKVAMSADGCWTWKASVNPHGYGQFMLPGHRLTRAHRLAWQIANGPLPDGAVVMHRCDNPPCVNPEHLAIGTQLDNIADMHAKGRASGGRTPRPGTQNPNAKVTDDQIHEIRRLRQAGITCKTVAGMFGISPAQVSRIATGKRWAHL